MRFNHILQDINSDFLLKKKSEDKSLVRATQVLLYSLGFGDLLGWEKYKADGDYGGGTSRAIASFIDKHDKEGNGESLNADILSLMHNQYALLPGLRALQHSLDNNNLNNYYGSNKGQAELQQLTKASNIVLESSTPTRGEAETIINKMKEWYGDGWQTSVLPSKSEGQDVTSKRIRNSSLKLSDPWISVNVKKHKKGVYTVGSSKPSNFIASPAVQDALIENNYSQSAIRVITPVSKHEGNLDAVNTWDNSFISFGMFQWTLGAKKNKGEIAALLNRIQEDESEAFEEHYGQFGLGVAQDSSRTIGYLTYKGENLVSPAAKAVLRTDEWAFRFWKSGQDPRIQFFEIIHALDRIRSFYHHDNYRPAGKIYIDELNTSEYGVALLLDHHVNRPGHLMNYKIGKNDIIGRALKNAGLIDSDPNNWSTNEESQLIEAYLPLRYKSSMTHSRDRAKKIRKVLDGRELSNERGSFSLENMTSRSLPDQANFPFIDFEEYESRSELMEI